MGACYRLSVQQIHQKYKSYRTTCHVTNLDHETDACKSMHPETCRNTTFTWLEHARPSTKTRHIIGAQRRGSYSDNVTVYPYNRCIRIIQLIIKLSQKYRQKKCSVLRFGALKGRFFSDSLPLERHPFGAITPRSAPHQRSTGLYIYLV